MMVKLVLDIATVAVRTQMGTATADHIEGATFHLTRYNTYHQTGTEVGGNTPNGVHETIAEAIVVAIRAEAIKRGVDGHVINLQYAQEQAKLTDGHRSSRRVLEYLALCACVCCG